MKDRMKRFTFETVLDYYEGRLAPEAAAKVREEIERDPNGLDLLGWLRQFMPVLRQAVPFCELNPSPSALVQARAIFRERMTSSAASSLKLLIARLVFDSRQELVAAGVRGAQPVSFQLLYDADTYHIDLWHERRTDGNWYLIGQVLPKNGVDSVAPERCSLIAADGRTVAATIQDGEFHVASAPTGSYQVDLDLPDCRLILQDVIIGPQGA